MISNPVLYHKTLVSIVNMFFLCKSANLRSKPETRCSADRPSDLAVIFFPWKDDVLCLFTVVQSYFPLICVEKSKNCVSRMETSDSSYYLLLHTVIGLIGTVWCPKVSFSESTMLSSTCASTRVEIVSFVCMYFNSALSVFSLMPVASRLVSPRKW